MVYNQYAWAAGWARSEVDLNGSLWYKWWRCRQSARVFWSWPQRVIMVYRLEIWCPIQRCSEVDLNGSLWYIARGLRHTRDICSEVDLNGSLWYSETSAHSSAPQVLKLTSTGHYGILAASSMLRRYKFWSWPQRVIMVYLAFHQKMW